jgi:hypothetical protein
MIEVEENQWAQAASELIFLPNSKGIKYPGINSCLSITLVCKRLFLVGAHAVLIPGLGQLVQNLDTATELADRRHLFFIGDTGTWESNPASLSGYGCLEGVAAALGMAEKYHVVDVVKWTDQGKNKVDIMFSPCGFYVVREQKTGHEHIRFYWPL